MSTSTPRQTLPRSSKSKASDYATAFHVLRPRLNAELLRSRNDEKATVQKRLQVAKDALALRNGHSEAPESPLASPTTPPMEIDVEELAEGGMAVVKAESNVPAPKVTVCLRVAVWR